MTPELPSHFNRAEALPVNRPVDCVSPAFIKPANPIILSVDCASPKCVGRICYLSKGVNHNMANRKGLWIALGLIGAGVCAIVCIFAFVIGSTALTLSRNALTAGSAAPDFELSTLDGDTITLSQFRGSPVLMELGATWCPDCRKTAPKLQELHETYTDLVVLSVDSQEDAGTVEAFAAKYGLTYPIVLDYDGAVSNQYQIWAIPTLFFIDGDGVIQEVLIESYSDARVAEALSKIGIRQ